MRIKNVLIGIAGLFVPFLLQAQEKKDSVLRFSLAEAKIYAQANSPVVKNSVLDLESAKKKIWETTAIGLPQVNGKLTFGYALQQSSLLGSINGLNQIGIFPRQQVIDEIRLDSLIRPSSYTNQSAGTIKQLNHDIDSLRNIKSGDLRTSIGLDISVNQLIFSGAYFVGLQTSKVFKSLSELAITKSQNDLIESVTNAYFLVLIARENQQILDSTYKNTSKIVNEILEQHRVGFVDETTADQMKINLGNLKATLDLITRQVDIATKLFKFQIGIEIEKQVLLTDSITGIISGVDFSALLNNSYAVESSVDFKLATTQEKLQELNLKYMKTNYLPTISAYYQFHDQLNKDYPDFQAPQMVGITASMPIFTSGQNMSRVAQARIALEKQKNLSWQAKEGLKIDYERTRSDYVLALDKFDIQKQNMELSKKIYYRSLIQFKEGMISGIELTQYQNQYLQTQSDYFSAISQLSSAKAKFEKLIASTK